MNAPKTPAELQRLRARKGWSQSELARLLRVSQPRVSQALSGKTGSKLPASWTERLAVHLEGKSPAFSKSAGRFHVPTKGSALRTLRLKAGKTQGEMGKTLGVSASMISRLENGKAELSESLRESIRSWLEGETLKEIAGAKHQGARGALEGRPAGHDGDDAALPWPVPRTGAELRCLGERFLEGGASMADLAGGIGVTQSELRRRFSGGHLPEPFRRKVRAVIAEMVSMPRTGAGLRRLIRDLGDDGVESPKEKLAHLGGISVKSLEQYSHRRQLPAKFQKCLKDYYRRDD